MKNDLPPSWPIQMCLTINCESSLHGLSYRYGNARVRVIALLAVSPSPDVSISVPAVVPKSCQEVWFATFSSLMSANPSSRVSIGDRMPYQLQSTTARCIFVRTIQQSHASKWEHSARSSPTPLAMLSNRDRSSTTLRTQFLLSTIISLTSNRLAIELDKA